MKLKSLFAGMTTAGSSSLLIAASLAACSKSQESGTSDSMIPSDSPAGVSESYHADHDIAMTVRSIVDAIQVGENLLSDDYDYKGVLTDGIGAPLYTDIAGQPGIWIIAVNSPGSVNMRNLNPGDLLAGDLRDYIASNLSLDDSRIVELLDDEEDNEIVTYDFGAGYLRFITHDTITPGGYESTMLNIQVSSKS